MRMISNRLITGLALVGTGWFSASSHANDDVYSLAQGCYAIQSSATGQFLQTNDSGKHYHFDAATADNASHFYFKPTDLGRYMMRDQQGGYLSTRLPRGITRGWSGSKWSQWGIDKVDRRYRLTSTKFGNWLRSKNNNGSPYFVDLLNPLNKNTDYLYNLVAQNDCAPFPEADLNAYVDPSMSPKSDVNQPIKGWADSHAHLTSWNFMGGKFLHGKPFDQYGIEKALEDGARHHGPWGALDVIGNIQDTQSGGINGRHDTRGYPDFPYWPNQHTMSHQHAYYRWVERAHLSGLKFMVSHVVENNVLCSINTLMIPVNWTGHNSCNEMSSADHQIDRLYDMQNYIDAQAGGPGKGFFRLVTSAQQARNVIANGQMAVMIGMETSKLFDCASNSGCSKEKIEQDLQYYYNRGVRTFFPVHRFDNGFGGASLKGANGLMNAANMLQNKHLFDAHICEGENQTWGSLDSGFILANNDTINGFLQVPVVRKLVGKLTRLLGVEGISKDYPQSQDDSDITHCNDRGITELGEYLINAMMDREMIIEIDHMSFKMQERVLEIAEQRSYSGLISGHGGFANKSLDHRVLALGGLFFPYNGSANGNIGQFKAIAAAQKQYPYLVGAGIGSDVNGLAPMAPRSSYADTNPVTYPFTSYDGRVTFYEAKTGNRTFDYNANGFEHYGLMADLVQDIRNNAENDVVETLFNGAEAYVQMWERVEAHNEIVNQPATYSQLYLPYLGKCLSASGTHNGAKIYAQDCNLSNLQGWRQEANGILRLAANPNKCLDVNRAIFLNGRDLNIWDCNSGKAQLFSEPRANDSGRLRVQHSYYKCVDVKGWGTGSKVEIHTCKDYSPGQMFVWRPKQVNQYSRLVNKQTGKCLDVPGGNGGGNGTKVQEWDCINGGDVDQQWRYEPLTGLIHNKANPLMCLDSRGNTARGAELGVWQCAPHDNLRFNIKQVASDLIEIHPRISPNDVVESWQASNGGLVNFRPQVQGSHDWSKWKTISPEYRELIHVRGGQCLDLEANNAYNYAKIQLYPCNGNNAQQWKLDDNGSLRNKAQPNFCVQHPDGWPYDGVHVRLWECGDKAGQTWSFSDGHLRPHANNSGKALIMDAVDHNRHREQVTIRDAIKGLDQRWQWGNGNFKRIWFTLQNNNNGQCLDAHSSQANNDDRVGFWDCHNGANQRWSYDPDSGLVRSKLNPNKCLSHPNGNPASELYIALWDCSINQAWNFDGVTLRPRANPDFAIGYQQGKAVLWPFHGESYQVWKAHIVE